MRPTTPTRGGRTGSRRLPLAGTTRRAPRPAPTTGTGTYHRDRYRPRGPARTTGTYSVTDREPTPRPPHAYEPRRRPPACSQQRSLTVTTTNSLSYVRQRCGPGSPHRLGGGRHTARPDTQTGAALDWHVATPRLPSTTPSHGTDRTEPSEVSHRTIRRVHRDGRDSRSESFLEAAAIGMHNNR